MGAHLDRFVWYDLFTLDLAAAKTFYGAVFGWGVQPHGEDYETWANGERFFGGLADLPADAKAMGAPPHWMAYISTDELDAKAAQATELGGKLFVPPTKIEGAGRFAVIADPQGGMFALYESTGDYDQPDPGVGDFSWGELATDSLDGATGFYQALFGWKTEDTDMGGGWMYRLFTLEGMGRHMGGMFQKQPDMPFPTHWLHYVTVADIDTTIEAIKAAGGKVMNGPMDVPGGDRVAQCCDDQGAGFGLHQSPPA